MERVNISSKMYQSEKERERHFGLVRKGERLLVRERERKYEREGVRKGECTYVWVFKRR